MNVTSEATPGLSTSSISQVSSPNNLGKRAGGIILGIIIALMVIWILWGSNSKHTATSDDRLLKPNYRSTDNDTGHALSNNASSEMSEKLRKLRAKMELENMAQQEKLYRMRQSAPIEMYAASMSSVSSGSSSVVDRANTTSAGGSTNSGFTPSTASSNTLPLSASQVDRLKSALGNSDPNTQFQQNISHTAVETADATRIAHTDYTVTQGTLIPGSLETAINSDLPGMVKAVVSMDIYAAAGNRVLIPKGSTLIGQYSSGIALGQQRVMVVWSRVIRPDGVDVMLGSSGTDSLGQGGLGADKVESHFWSRFGEASLLSIIGAGIANVGVNPDDQFNSAAAYRSAIANNFQQTAGSSLLGTISIKPTIHVNQGARINVFVNRDLSFYDALAGNS